MMRGVAHERTGSGGIEGDVLGPLGEQHDDVGADRAPPRLCRRRAGRAAIARTGVGAGGVGRDDGGAAPPEPSGDVEGGRVAHVVAVGLEGEAEHGHLDPDEATAGHLGRDVDGVVAAAQVDRVDLAQEGQRLVDAELAGAGHEGADVLGQAAAAEADAGAEELVADALVVADRLGEACDVAAGGVAQLGHRVDERDLRGEEGVGGDLDELGRGVVDHQSRRAPLEDGRIDPVEGGPADLAALPVLGEAVDDPVGGCRVLHGKALAEELRVPHHDRVEVCAGHPVGDRLRGAHGHRRLADDDGRAACRARLACSSTVSTADQT